LGEEGKTEKRKQNVGHCKPFSWSRDRREIERKNDKCPPLSFLFPVFFPLQLASSQCPPADALTSLLLTTTNSTSHLKIHINSPAIPSTLTLLMACWALEYGISILSLNLRNKLHTYPYNGTSRKSKDINYTMVKAPDLNTQ